MPVTLGAGEFDCMPTLGWDEEHVAESQDGW